MNTISESGIMLGDKVLVTLVGMAVPTCQPAPDGGTSPLIQSVTTRDGVREQPVVQVMLQGTLVSVSASHVCIEHEIGAEEAGEPSALANVPRTTTRVVYKQRSLVPLANCSLVKAISRTVVGEARR